jgi:hypothetical protein
MTFALTSFMNDLLMTSHVDPSEVVIVEDNADASQEFSILEEEAAPLSSPPPPSYYNRKERKHTPPARRGFKELVSPLLSPPSIFQGDAHSERSDDMATARAPRLTMEQERAGRS